MSESREIVPSSSLVRHGTTGVGGVVGGALLLILGGLAGPWAWIVGSAVAVAGVVISASGREDRVTGGVVAGAGVLTILSGIGWGIGGALLTLGGVGLLAMGGVGLYKFVKGLRTRR